MGPKIVICDNCGTIQVEDKKCNICGHKVVARKGKGKKK